MISVNWDVRVGGVKISEIESFKQFLYLLSPVKIKITKEV